MLNENNQKHAVNNNANSYQNIFLIKLIKKNIGLKDKYINGGKPYEL